MYLELSRKINFSLVSEISQKKRVSSIDNTILIYLHLWNENYVRSFLLEALTIIASFTQTNSFSYFFLKWLNNFVVFITPVVQKWRIRIKCLEAAAALLVVSRFWRQDCSNRSIEEIIRWVTFYRQMYNNIYNIAIFLVLYL